VYVSKDKGGPGCNCRRRYHGVGFPRATGSDEIVTVPEPDYDERAFRTSRSSSSLSRTSVEGRIPVIGTTTCVHPAQCTSPRLLMSLRRYEYDCKTSERGPSGETKHGRDQSRVKHTSLVVNPFLPPDTRAPAFFLLTLGREDGRLLEAKRRDG
jgi:hypothetical protein